MKQESVCEDESGVNEGPVLSSVSARAKNRYGSVPGLEDEELADPAELERQVMMQEWGPVLMLPVRRGTRWVQPTVDENGKVEWGAFGSVDFAKTIPEFDKARYKVDMLREKRRDTLIMFSIVKERLPAARNQVLKYLERGVIELDQIENEDMRALARLHLRARRLDAEIRRLLETSHQRRRERFTEVLG